MARKNREKEIQDYIEAISFVKSVKEKAPSNPKVTDELEKMEKRFHDAFYEFMNNKTNTGKQK
jgi:hypothetical protein